MKKLDENLIKRIKEQAITYSEKLNSDFIDKIYCNLDIALSYRRILEQLRYDFIDLTEVCKDAKVNIRSKDDVVVIDFDTLRYRYHYDLNVENGYYKMKGLLDAIDFICHLERYKKHELFIVDYLTNVLGATCPFRDKDGMATFIKGYAIGEKLYCLHVKIDVNNFIEYVQVIDDKDKKIKKLPRELKIIASDIYRLKEVAKTRMNANALKYYRVINGLTMEELATKSGLTKTFIYLLESNRQDIEKISFDKIIRLSKALHVNPLDLTRYGVDMAYFE